MVRAASSAICDSARLTWGAQVDKPSVIGLEAVSVAAGLPQVLHRLVGQDDCAGVRGRWLDLQERRRDAEQPTAGQWGVVEELAILDPTSAPGWLHSHTRLTFRKGDAVNGELRNISEPCRSLKVPVRTRLKNVMAFGSIGGWRYVGTVHEMNIDARRKVVKHTCTYLHYGTG